MNKVYNLKFSLFIIFDVLGLYLCSFLLKRVVKKFPNKLIPLVNVILSIVTTMLYLDYHFEHKAPIRFLFVMGCLDGLAATGLHRLIKQTHQYLTIKKTISNLKKDKRKVIS